MSHSSGTLSQFSTEFGIIEHKLRLQLGSPKCVISQISSISLKASEVQFKTQMRRMENPNVVDVFVPIEKLGKTLHEVQNVGIEISSTTGYKICPTKLDISPGSDEYTIIHMLAALGKVYCNIKKDRALEEEDVYDTAPINSDLLPEGFDSLRVSNDDEFVIFKSSQLYPLHIIKVKGGDNVENHDPQDFICDYCHKRHAGVYCINDKLKLCHECDQSIHNGNEITKNHERKELKEVIAMFQECPEHPGKLVQYYCPQCNLPVCMECKVSGNHSHRGNTKHKLIPIDQMYKEKGEEVQTQSIIRQQREKVLKQEILAAEVLKKSLATNLDNMIDEINRIAAAAIEEAKLQTEERMICVKSSLSELQRKYDQLCNQRKLVINTFQNNEPLAFLQTYARNNLLDKDIESNFDLQTTNDIKLDLSVGGNITILTDANKVQDAKHKLTQLRRNHVKVTTLDKMAARKEKKYEASGKELTFKPFDGSEIISDPELAKKLYLCFPFKAMPETHLMFSTKHDGRDIKTMHKKVDGKGISVILVRSKGRVFGGFAASKWTNDSRPFGEGTSSFLFSVDNNAFIPASPQAEDPIYLIGTPDTFSFGRNDLVLAENFDRCGSTIENTFGIGLEYGGKEAQTFLADAPIFSADDVEVWGFFSSQ